MNSNTNAAIWLQQSINNNNENLPLEKAFADTLHSSKHWRQIIVTITIDKAVSSFSFGGLLNGIGKVWFDDFSLLIDGKEVVDIAKSVLPSGVYEIKWINQHLILLTSLEPNNLNRDLDSFSTYIGNSKIVAQESRHMAQGKHLFSNSDCLNI